MTTMRCCTSTTSWNGATAAVSCAPWQRRSRTSCAARRRRRPRWAPTPSVRWATLTGYATDSDTPAGYFIPTDEPFIVWNQRAAIFKAARHPATAKLLLSYLGSAEFQSSYGGWRAAPTSAKRLGCRHWSR